MEVDDPTLPFPVTTSTRAERAALRVVQLGAVAVIVAATTYKVFELDRFFVPKEMALQLAAFLAGLLALGAARRAEATRVDLWLVGFLLLSAVSGALATNPWAAMRALGVSVASVLLFWVARMLRRAGLARPLLAALALAVVLAAVTSLLQTYGVETEVFSINRAPGGTLGNRNFVAHVAAFGLPLLLLALLRARSGPGFLAAVAGIGICVAALVLSRSRAAWLALIAVMAVLLVGALLSPPVRRDWRVAARFLLALLFAGGGVAAAILLPNTLHWKSDAPYLETARGVVNYQEGSGRGRLIQYGNSLRMALEHPVLGVGPGNWSVVYPEYASRNDPSLAHDEAGTTANPWPSSDWVAFLSERGVPAFLLLLLAGVGIFVGGWRRMRAARDTDEGLQALALLATLAGIVVVGAFDAALLLAWPALIVWSALGALWAPEVVRHIGVGSRGRVLALLLVTLAAGAGAVRATAQLASMGIYATSESRSDLQLAARLDPGSYRVHLRLARTGTHAARCRHAVAAHHLFPRAAEGRRLAGRCD
jgi:O-antigen ligase